jgi:hypothetical protein
MVERHIIDAVSHPAVRETLKADIFNIRAWEEAILFAIERMARGGTEQQAASGTAIIAAFEVDPILAAEIIFRATDDVWKKIASTIQDNVRLWHTPEEVDRALRFMLTSGRPEFLDEVWPLITCDNQRIISDALGNCVRFRPSILGKDAEKKIQALPIRARVALLYEIASSSGMDGLDLACAIAKTDPDPGVQVSVVDAFAFRRADRHVAEVLRNASAATFDLVVRNTLLEEVKDEEVQKGLAAARARLASGDPWGHARLSTIVQAQGKEDFSRTDRHYQ